MKKFLKPLKYLGLGVLLGTSLLYLINLIPVSLDPEVEAVIQQGPPRKLQGKEYPIPEIVKLIHTGDLKSEADFKTFRELLEQNPYPTDLRFPNTARIINYIKWNDRLLKSLEKASEPEKFKAVSNTFNFIESGLHTQDTLLHSIILLTSLRNTAQFIKVQEFTEQHREIFRERLSKLIEERVEILKSTLDGEFQLTRYFISITKEGGIGVNGSFLESEIHPLWRPFLNENATLNESFALFDDLKSKSDCLQNWTCQIEDAPERVELWKTPRNPIGKALISEIVPQLHSKFNKLQLLWKEIESAVL